jgi:hypothetical protein
MESGRVAQLWGADQGSRIQGGVAARFGDPDGIGVHVPRRIDVEAKQHPALNALGQQRGRVSNRGDRVDGDRRLFGGGSGRHGRGINQPNGPIIPLAAGAQREYTQQREQYDMRFAPDDVRFDHRQLPVKSDPQPVA